MSHPLLAQNLLRWYDAHRRDLPWRPPPDAPLNTRPPAYHVLVSEAMLQQTQVATVIPYFHRFLEAFPTIESLALADEERVLRLWQGLGYYSRARNLRKTAQAIVERFNGRVPEDVESLLTLPGVGRYTAGAIASIAHGTRAPIVDGNVIRVLCRLDAIESDPRDKATVAALWTRAEEILPDQRTGDFNSAMMELGATVCTPRNPSCLICPVQSMCAAFKKQIQDRIPPPKSAKETPHEKRYVLCLQREDGKYLIEQRPPTGRWASMWQFLTSPEKDWKTVHPLKRLRRLAQLDHALTHRRYTFDVYTTSVSDRPPEASKNQRWATIAEMEHLPFPRPHLKIRDLLRTRKD